MNTPAKIFIAYSRKDVDYLNELRSHLTPLERSERIKVWYDGKIEAGRDWEASIKDALYSADIILLLVSADSISSEYFYGKEVNASLERHRQKEARVIPIILRPCAWEDTPLSELQALPKDAKAITDWTSRDSAYDNIAKTIGQLVKEDLKPVSVALLPEVQAPPIVATETPQKKPSSRPIWQRPAYLYGGLAGVFLIILLAIFGFPINSNKETEKQEAIPVDTSHIVLPKPAPDRFQTFLAGADSLYKFTKFDLASDLYDSALVMRPDSYAAREGKRKSQDELNRLGKSQRFEAVLQEAENLFAAGKYKAALAQFQKSSSVLSGDPRTKKGIDKCNAAISKMETEAKKQKFEALVNQAKNFQNAAKYAEAKAKYEEANKLFPNDKRVSEGIAACNRALIINAVNQTETKMVLMNPQISSLSITINTGNDDLGLSSDAYIVVGTKGKGKKEYLLNKGLSFTKGSQKTMTVNLMEKVNQSDINYLGIRFQPSPLSTLKWAGVRDNWLLDKILIRAEGKTLLSEKVNKRFTSTDSVWGENVSF